MNLQRIFGIVVAIGFALIAPSHAFDQNPIVSSRSFDNTPAPTFEQRKYVPGEVLVRFKPGVTEATRKFAHRALGGRLLRALSTLPGLQHIELPRNVDVEEAIAQYLGNPDVLYAEPNYMLQAAGIPDDPQFPFLWGLDNLGDAGGTLDSDIDAPEAWAITTGDSQVVIAVIDSGVDYNHEDLIQNIYTNPADCNADGVDDDGNGFVDDCHGIDTLNNDSDPFDDNGHGTHVAGIIGASGNNGIGVVGVSWNVSLLACKFLDKSGFGNVADAIRCLDYVSTLKGQGVNIIATNNSWSGSQFSQALLDAIDSQRVAGILFVAAAGNDFRSNDIKAVYPANYALPNILSVAATTRTDEVALFSNTGSRSVHLGAPGKDILSTLPGDTYGFASGTSMATPHVAGATALLKSQDSSRDWKALRNLILTGGDGMSSLDGTITGRRLNAHGSLTCVNEPLQLRLHPSRDQIAAAIDSPVRIEMLNLNCASPSGTLQVSVSPGGQLVTLFDDGTGADQDSGDGNYTGQWIPTALGSYTLSFPNGESLLAQVLDGYDVTKSSFAYRSITGTNLNLGDDDVVRLSIPFPMTFGGGQFQEVFVSSNGTVSFTDSYSDFSNRLLPLVTTPVVTLIAPFWDDLFPIPQTPQNVFWEVVGSAPNRELVIEWRNIQSFTCRNDPSATVTFQAVFSEQTSEILFNYADTTFGGDCALSHDNGASATVGVQVAPDKGTTLATGLGLQNIRNDQILEGGQTYIWKLQGEAPAVNPEPVLDTIAPSTVLRSDGGFTLHLDGSNFIPDSVVRWDGFARPTTLIDGNQLSASISDSDVIFTGNPVEITVFNPEPGGGTSGPKQLTFETPQPVVNSLSPSTVEAGDLSFHLSVVGDGFTGASMVRVNGVERFTSHVDIRTLSVAIGFTEIAEPGEIVITVANSSAGGDLLSNPAILTVTPPSVLGQSLYAINAGTAADGTEADPGLSHHFNPRKFLGWNYAREQDEKYQEQFSRPRGMGSVPHINPDKESTQAFLSSGLGTTLMSPDAASIGLQLRESLMAGFIPTDVTAGDFNNDGLADWIVSSGGDNTLWLYLGKGDGGAEHARILPIRGRTPLAVDAADLQGDGNLDLVIVEVDSGAVAVMMGLGGGNFQSEIMHTLPAPPVSLLVDDFTGDGFTDILVGLLAGFDIGPVAVLPGDGTGAFGKPIFGNSDPRNNFPLLSASLAAGDVDNDGDQDLIVNDLGPVNIGSYAYLNNGDGTFKLAGRLVDGFFGNAPVASRLGDLDEDGCLDAVMLTPQSTAIVRFGDCDGTFQTGPGFMLLGEGDSGFGFELLDLNGDNHLDLVSSGVVLDVSSIFGQEAGFLLSIQLGRGDGSFELARVYRGEASAFSLAAADLNLDGFPDIITANQDNDTCTVFLNDGSGGFGIAHGKYIGYVTSENPPNSIFNAPLFPFVADDIDSDGDSDLLVVEWGRVGIEPRQITILLNDGTGSFGDPIRSPGIDGTLTYHGDFVLGDFRNSGLVDYVGVGSMFSSGESYISFVPNLGGGRFGKPRITQPQNARGLVDKGDFNRDGNLDLVVFNQTGFPSILRQRYTIFLGNGDGTFLQGETGEFGGPYEDRFPWPESSFVDDFDADGNLDVLLWTRENTVPRRGHNLFLIRGRGDGTFFGGTLLFDHFSPLTVADLNGDGILDIVESVEADSPTIDLQFPEINIYLGDGAGGFTLTETYAPYAGVAYHLAISHQVSQSPSLGDFNGDGNLDIAVFQLARSNAGPYVQFLIGNGDGTFVPTFNIHRFSGRFYPDLVGDWNGDGRSDFAQLSSFQSSYHSILSEAGTPFQIRLRSSPVVGSTGFVELFLNIPRSTSTSIGLSVSTVDITIPPSVTIPAGEVQATVPFTLEPTLDSSQVFEILATLEGRTLGATSFVAADTNMVGFQAADTITTRFIRPGEETLRKSYSLNSVGGYGTTAQIACGDLPLGATCSLELDTLELAPGGRASTDFVISTSPDTPVGIHSASIIATDGTFTVRTEVLLRVNTPPIPDPGPNQLVESPDTQPVAVLLDGTASTDPDGSPLTYLWTGPFPEGGGEVSGPAPIVTLPVGTHLIGLVVNDGFEDSGRPVVRIVVNTRPVADAGLDSVQEATSAAGTSRVQLDGRSSFDPNGDTLQFTWTGPFLEGDGTITGAAPTVTVPAGNQTVQLVVDDGKHSSDPDSVQIDVTDFVLSSSQASATVQQGQSVSFTVTAAARFGPFDNIVAFRCSNLPLKTTCLFSPSSGSPGAASFDTTVTILTTAPSTAYPKLPNRSFPLPIAVVGILSLFVLMRSPERDVALMLNRPARIRFLMVVILSISLLACGGGRQKRLTGTPTGTFTVSFIGASGALERATQIHLTVK